MDFDKIKNLNDNIEATACIKKIGFRNLHTIVKRLKQTLDTKDVEKVRKKDLMRIANNRERIDPILSGFKLSNRGKSKYINAISQIHAIGKT